MENNWDRPAEPSRLWIETHLDDVPNNHAHEVQIAEDKQALPEKCRYR